MKPVSSHLQPDDETRPEERPWSTKAQDVAAVLWPSFLVAAFATMLFFAWVDPEALVEVTTPSVSLSRTAGYSIGFFFFWLMAAVSSIVTLYLVRTAHETRRSRLGNVTPGEFKE